MPDSFGQELKRLAEAKGFDSQDQLAKASGVSQPMVGKLFLDQRPNVSAAILFKLCRALGVDCRHFEPFLSAVEEESAAKGKPKAKPKKK